VELHTIRHGYCGMVEVTGGVTNLCCWIATEALRHMGGRPQPFLAAASEANAYLGKRMQKAKQVDASWTTTSVAGRRAAIPVADTVWNIGDCAAMIAPLTGDGMGMGLRAAELAATTLLAAFREELSWDQVTAAYVRGWQREFRSRLRWGRVLEVLLRQPRLASLSCLALHCSPSLLEQMYRRTRHLLPATGSALEAS
jgi:flavin-dependent dehydrogenase